MTSKTKLAIVCALLACVLAAVWLAATRKPHLTNYTYSQFLDQVRNGQVSDAIIIGTNSGAAITTFHLKNGQSAQTVLPSEYRDALRAMQDKLVNIEIRDASSEPRRILLNATPFLLLLAVWIVLMIWKFPNGPRRSLVH